MSEQPLAWLSFGVALQQAGTTVAPSAAQDAFEQGLAANPSAEVRMKTCWRVLCRSWLTQTAASSKHKQ